MNRKPFKHRLVASLQTIGEEGVANRADIEEAIDGSKSTVASWYATDAPGSVKPNLVLPDVHDLHGLALNLWPVAEAIFGIVLDGSGHCVVSGDKCGQAVRPAQVTDGFINVLADVSSEAKEFQRSAEDGRIDLNESASLQHRIRKTIADLQKLDTLIGKLASDR